MSKNHKAWKKLLPCLALSAILIFCAAMRFPADAISPKPATIQASTGDYFNLAYEKTLEFVQPLWEKVKLFSDQPKDWNEISQNLIQYAKEKPLMAAAVGGGIIWIPFGLFRAFRSRNEEEENPEYDEFMSSEFEEEEEDEEDEFEEDDEDGTDDEEEYQKNLREFNEDDEEETEEEILEEAALLEEETEEEVLEEATLLESETDEETLEEAALLEDETEEEVFEDFESESLEDNDDDFGFLEEDENDDLLFEDEEEDEFAALREEEDLSEDDEFSDIFSESTSDDEITDPVPAKSFTSDTDNSDDILKKLENEFASLESEFSEVDDFIDQENKKSDPINISDDVDSGSEKTLSHEGEVSSEVDQLLSASESLSNLDSTSAKDLTSDPFESKELPSNIMDIINKEAVMSDPVSSDHVGSDSTASPSKKFEIESLEDEEELDQTLKDLQAEMEQTIQEISSQIGSEPQYHSDEETEAHTTSDTSSIEEETLDDSPFQSAPNLAEEENDESDLEEILQKAEEEAEKDLKDLLPVSNVFLEEESNEPTIVEDTLSETQTIPDTVEETFKDVFAEALDTNTFQEIESEEEIEDHDLTTTGLEAASVDEIISFVENENLQETNFTDPIIAEEKPVELPDLIEESPEAFDPLLPALDAATHEEKTLKPEDKQIDSVKANSYIKSLGAFQRNLENRLNTLKYFPPIEEAKTPTPKAQEFEAEEPVLTNEPDIDFDHIGESPEKKYSLELMESFILLDNQK